MKKRYYARRIKVRRRVRARFFVIVGLFAVLVVGVFFIVKALSDTPGDAVPPGASVEMSPPDDAVVLPGEDEPQETEPSALLADIIPHATENTEPAKFGFTTDIMVGGETEDSYIASETMSFGAGHEYTALEGITTFRGNNYRDMPSWGTAQITEGKLEVMPYNKKTGSIGSWRGAAWTGQPLIVKWPEQTRSIMTSLYEPFRDKQDFVEVIYATLDGRIYFMELETGEKTRDFINVGAPTKGTPSLDPRGYPIIYVGQGLQADGDDKKSRNMYVRAFSLIDGSKLMEFGAPSGDPFAHRDWQAYDSSPLISAATDTLIQPGENGVIYFCKLNTVYDDQAGTLSMDDDPEKVKYRYSTPRNEAADDNGRWGIENSAVAWRDYLIFTDNIGMLQCINLNTLELVYANDLTDDSDVSMVLEEDTDNNTFYLYTGCEYDKGVRKDGGSSADAYARKIDGITGEILWEEPFTVASPYPDGGILASPVLGRDGTSIAGLIIYNVTQKLSGESNTSTLVALDKHTGKQVWEYDMGVSGWSPSSPVPVYTEDGKGYIVQCDKGGNVALLRVDGQSYEVADRINVGDSDNFEATPAVYGNTIVVASRKGNIFFIKIK